MFGNRGVYHRGWSAVTKHKTPWLLVDPNAKCSTTTTGSVRRLVHYSRARDLATEQPERLASLQRLWLIEAAKYNVLPMDDRTGERLNPDLAGRPTLIRGDSQLFFPGMGRLSENSVVSIKNRSFSVTAEVDIPNGGAEGVIIAQGGRFGGWAVYAKDGRATFAYNVLGIQEFTTVADTPIPEGRHQVRLEFAYDGGGLARGGDVTLYYDGKEAGKGRVGATQPMVFSADETTDIGYELGTTVSSEYTAQGSRFTGKIGWVQIDLGKDDHDHFLDPDERLRVAMARSSPVCLPPRHHPAGGRGSIGRSRLRRRHGSTPSISTSSEKLRNVLTRTISPRVAALSSVWSIATVRMMSAMIRTSRPSRIERPRL